ncbi:MAG TPA: hypothetical protein VIA06_23475 [Candidatus Dormibacteraeota bacterium]|nr:hypothetical protein [Candidatus Dormibacteraeota bacterium]
MTPPPRYFERRQIREAIEFAEAGGIAVHRNLDRYHGQLSRGGRVMERPFLHVIGLRAELEEWARGHGVPLEAIQPERRRKVAHIDVFGSYAEALLRALGEEDRRNRG